MLRIANTGMNSLLGVIHDPTPISRSLIQIQKFTTAG